MQFSFAFSGKLHRVSISSGNRPRCTKCVSILSSEGFGCRLIDSLFIISDCFSFVKNFFKTFFEVFEAILSKLKLFWPPSLSKQLIYYIKPKPVCQELFSFFSSRFSVRPPCLSATALIEYHSERHKVKHYFQKFSRNFYEPGWSRRPQSKKPHLPQTMHTRRYQQQSLFCSDFFLFSS